MTSVMTLDGVTPFLCLKDVRNTCKRMQHSPTIGGISSVQWRKVGSSLNVFSSFIVCLNHNRSALLRELLSNNSLFVSQL